MFDALCMLFEGNGPHSSISTMYDRKGIQEIVREVNSMKAYVTNVETSH
jgi:hypothetical protein